MAPAASSVPTVIIEHYPLLREGLAAFLRDSVYKVVSSVAAASDLRGMPSLAERRVMVLLGAEEGDPGVAQASATITRLRSLFPHSRIVVVAEKTGPVELAQMFATAADSYIANISSREILLKVLDLASLDQTIFALTSPKLSAPSGDAVEPNKTANLVSLDAGKCPETSSDNAGHSNRPHLSQRERQVLLLLTQGDSNKVIARICNITESTVKVHLKTILRKLGAHNRTQAAIWAIAKENRAILSADCPVLTAEASVSLAPEQVPKWRNGHGTSSLVLNGGSPRQ